MTRSTSKAMSPPRRTEFGRRLATPPALIIAALFILAAHAPAAGPGLGSAETVIARCGSATITRSELLALLATLPSADRANIVSNPPALAELLRNALLQARLLAKAEAASWQKRPDVAAAALRARDAEIVRSYVAHEIPPQPTPTDSQLTPLYEANKARFMLPRQFHLAQIFLVVRASASPADAQRSRAQLVDARAAIAGKPSVFAATARRLSQDARSSPSGGDLGWLAESALVGPIKDAVAGLQVGAISDPVRTDDGWHLLELIATRPAGPASFAQARPVLAKAYAEQQAQAATREYLDTVLQTAPVMLDQAALHAFVAQDAPG
jgi:peptidylprolyl isomerase